MSSQPVSKEVTVTFTGDTGEAGQWSFSENPVELDRGLSTLTYNIEGWNFRAISIGQAEPVSDEGFVDARSGDEGQSFTTADELVTVTLTTLDDNQIVLNFNVSTSLASKMVLAVVLTVGKSGMRRSSRDPQIVLKPDGP